MNREIVANSNTVFIDINPANFLRPGDQTMALTFKKATPALAELFTTFVRKNYGRRPYDPER
ncbi:MAG TPA: hypothetical protein VFI29_08875 [Hanamia sp.]|nr:hypothetical protein [Hanamia sp.]